MAAETSFPLHHGSIALMFAGTVGDRGSTPFERLTSPQALGRWLIATGLIEPKAAISDAFFKRAIALREAIASATRAVAEKLKPAAADVNLINDYVRCYPTRTTLDRAKLTIHEEAPQPVGAALGRLARDAVRVLGEESERSRLRICGAPSCASVFLTPAGGKERRWCTMARCGNRAKVASFRDRSRHI